VRSSIVPKRGIGADNVATINMARNAKTKVVGKIITFNKLNLTNITRRVKKAL